MMTDTERLDAAALDKFEQDLRSKKEDGGLNYYEAKSVRLIAECRALMFDLEFDNKTYCDSVRDLTAELDELRIVNDALRMERDKAQVIMDVASLSRRVKLLEVNSEKWVNAVDAHTCPHCYQNASEPGPEHSHFCPDYISPF